jgi:glycosyltransferase involved in cell wall biosynthesis
LSKIKSLLKPLWKLIFPPTSRREEGLSFVRMTVKRFYQAAAELVYRVIPPPAVELPSPKRHPVSGRLKVCLAVDTLDRGGLEELVGQVVRGLPEQGVEAFVLCVKSGGYKAGELKKDGLKVYEADESAEAIARILAEEQPEVVNSHWAHLRLLQAAHAQGIPVVETIHSSYIWLDREGWRNEQVRSQYFSQAIATSETTRRFYTRHNPWLKPEWVRLVGNGVDAKSLELPAREAARRELGLSEDEFLFVNIASYDGVKNHLGLLYAFDKVAQKQPKVRLLCAGNLASPNYYEQVTGLHKELASRKRIQLCEYREDVGRLLSAGDAFVLNSFSEGWSIAATEALMAGLPLIHSECGSAYELVGAQGERGIIVPNPATEPINMSREIISWAYQNKYQRNTSELIAAMQRLVDEREIWQGRREEIKRQAQDLFSMENTTRGYVQVFRDCA